MANGSQFSRAKTWGDEDLTDTDLNAEFDNILNSLDADGAGSAETTAANAKEDSDPGTFASPNVPAAIHDQIKHLRFILARLIGGTNTSHLDIPATSIESLAANSQQLHIGLEFEGNKGGASSTTDVLAKLINQGAIINAVSLSSADVAAADFDSSNVKFGTYSYGLGTGNFLAFPGIYGNVVKGSLTAWFRNLAAGDYIAFNPLLGIELYADSVSGRLTLDLQEKIANGESAKATNQVQGSSTRTGDTTFRNVVAKWRSNDENGASTDLLELEYEGADEGTQLTAQDLDINPGDGGVWFFGAKRNDPSWDHFYSANDTPDNHSSAWTEDGTSNGAVSSGVLNIATTASNEGRYTRTDLVDLSQQTIEFKMRVNSTTESGPGDSAAACAVFLRDDTMDRSVGLNFYTNRVELYIDGSSPENIVDINLDTTQYHIYRLTSNGGTSPTTNLYIDGALVATGTNDNSDTTAADTLTFGDRSTTASKNSDSDWEYFAIYDAGAEAPLAASTQGQLDSIGVVSAVLSDTDITALQSSRVSDVLQGEIVHGPTLPLGALYDRTNSATVATSTYSASGNKYYIAGDGATEYMFSASESWALDAGEQVRLAIDVDSDIAGEATTSAHGVAYMDSDSGNAAGVIGTASITRAVLLTPGLHTVQTTVNTQSGTVARARSGAANTFDRTIAKNKRLGE